MRSMWFFALAGLLFVCGCVNEIHAQRAVSTTIVINEVYGGAGCAAQGCSAYDRDFIELKNISANPINLTGWSVQYASGTSTNPTWNTLALTGTIAAGGHYLIGQATGAAGTGVNTLPTPDASGTTAMSATTGKVALLNVTTPIMTGTVCPITSPNPAIIDFVGYGAQAAGTLCFEGAGTAPAPSTTNSVARNAAGADTDNNMADFTAGAPTPQNGGPSAQNYANLFDFDGDSKTDISIFRPSGGEWWYQRSSDQQVAALVFGVSTDRIVPADYTGDGKTDVAIFRPSTSSWFILRSEDGTFYSFPFGAAGDVPAPADYDGDGKADVAIYRPSNSLWVILQSSNGQAIFNSFGTAGDIPVAADYDGDGKADLAIWRPNGVTISEWWILRSTAGTFAAQFGINTDKPVPGDYTGDGKTDIAMFRGSTGGWLILRSEDFSYFGFPWGANGDIPASGDYDGDGKFDAAVFRPSTSTWFANRTTGGPLILPFGTTGDKPVPSAFIP